MFARGEIALSLARAGFYIFPGIPGGKKPAIKKWPRDATRDEATIRGWWSVADYNICILCGRPDGATDGDYLVVIDYDGKQGKRGLETYLKHTAAGLLPTMRVKTPNGVHAYFWSPTPIPNSVSRIAEHVDVRGVHGYVVGPGSALSNKQGTYEWIRDSNELPQLLPTELLIASATRSETERPDNVTEFDSDLLDSPRAIERARTYIINEAPEAIEGKGGDNTTFAVAQRIRAFGVSLEPCYEMMLDHYNEVKCFPPWSEEELRKKVENAYKYASLPPGNANPELEFMEANIGLILDGKDKGSTQGVNVKPPRQGPQFLDMSRWDRKPDPVIEWILAQLIPAGEAGLITGVGGVGKSILVLAMCICIVMGIPFLGFPTRKGPVLYIGAEEPEHILELRLKIIARYYGFTFEQLIANGLKIWSFGDAEHPPVMCRPNDANVIITTDLYQDVYDWARDNQPAMIVLDPLTHVYGGSEIDRVQVYTGVHHFRRIARVGNCAVAILGHPSLQGIASGSGVSGSTAWHAAVRWRCYLTAAPKRKKNDDDDESTTIDAGYRWLKFMKNQYGPPQAHVPLQWSNGVFVNVTDLDRRIREIEIEDVFMELLHRFMRQGRVVSPKSRAPNYAPAQFAQEDEARERTVPLSIDDLNAAMIRLYRDGKICNEDYWTAARNKVDRVVPTTTAETGGGSIFD